MSKMPIRREKSPLCGKAEGTLPASGLPLPPYFPPCEGTANISGDYAIDRDARTPPRLPAGPAESLRLQAFLPFRFVSVGPRYPPGRIDTSDAPTAPEVVLGVPAVYPGVHKRF